MWVAAERPPRTRAARLFVFSRTCVIISKPVTPCKTFRGNMAEFFNRLLAGKITRRDPLLLLLGEKAGMRAEFLRRPIRTPHSAFDCVVVTLASKFVGILILAAGGRRS